MKRFNRRAICLALVLMMAYSLPAIADDASQGIDTTRVRETKKIKKSTSEIIADIPGEVVKLPVYAVRLIALSATRPPLSRVTSLIDFSAPARSYIPIVGYSPNAGLKIGFGLRKLKRLHWDDKLDFKWYYSTNHYQSYQFRYRVREFLTDRVGVDLFYRYRKRPNERFFGMGIDCRSENEANYTLEYSDFRLDAPFHAGDRISVGLNGGFLIANLYDGEEEDFPRHLDSIAAEPAYNLRTGRLDGSRYIRFGCIATYDSRDNGGQPSKGFHILTRVVRYLGVDRSKDDTYWETKVDIRHYFNVWKKRILATRLYVRRFDADDGNASAAPINLVSRLGGADGLRGYSSGRFIDNDLALASIEWRFPVWEILDGFVFLDEGCVYERITGATVFRGWEYSAGFGLRVWNPNEVSFMTMIASSDEDLKFYVTGGATF